MQNTDVNVTRVSSNPSTQEETKTGGTLYQMMSAGKEKVQPFDPSMQKSIKDKRIEFELNQSNAQKAS